MPRIRPYTSKASSKPRKVTHPTPPKRTKHSYSNGTMKQIFSGCRMSLAGDFIAEHPGPNAENQWCYEKISKWIQAHGGEYAREVDEYTTHLIVTIKEYQKKSVQGMFLMHLQSYIELLNLKIPFHDANAECLCIVRKAMAMGKRCHIVVIDWLVDCLTLKTNKKKKLVVTGYTLGRVVRRLNYTEHQKIEYRRRFEEGVQAGKELCDNRTSCFFLMYPNLLFPLVLVCLISISSK